MENRLLNKKLFLSFPGVDWFYIDAELRPTPLAKIYSFAFGFHLQFTPLSYRLIFYRKALVLPEICTLYDSHQFDVLREFLAQRSICGLSSNHSDTRSFQLFHLLDAFRHPSDASKNPIGGHISVSAGAIL